MDLEELEALLILTSMPNLGSIKIRLLVQHFGSALQAIKASIQDLSHLSGFGPKILESWCEVLKNQAWKKDLLLVEEHQANLITYLDPLYPKRLLELSDFPIILYLKGTFSKQDQQRGIAVVGTRHASLYGIEMAKKISYDLARAGFTIISGLARGIDTAAHQGALEAGRTIALLGSGLTNIYPMENTNLAQSIMQQGAIISEFPMHTPPDRTHFPQRNRIVSGMSIGTILIEAPQKSGAMLTVNKAISQGRPVFVLPGRADIENFRGNHALIKEKKALLVENSQDVINFFEDLLLPALKPIPKTEPIQLENEEVILIKHLSHEELSLDEILKRTQFSIQKINILLMSLVLKKAIKEYPGKIYKKI